MFGGDWPVCLAVGAEDRDVVELADRLVSSLNASEAAGFWRRNAERFHVVRVAG